MPGLIDIAPLVETIDVRGTKLEVRGVSASAVAALLWRFPELRKMWATGDWDVPALMRLSEDVIAAVIAAGTGDSGSRSGAGLGSETAEAAARNLALGEKAELLAAILRVTMPNGIGSFTEALSGLMDVGAGGASRGGRATKSPTPSKA